MRGTRIGAHDNLPDWHCRVPPVSIRSPFMTPKPPARSKPSRTSRTSAPHSTAERGPGARAYANTSRTPAARSSASRGPATRAPAYAKAAPRPPADAYARPAAPAVPPKPKPLSAHQKRYLRGFAHDLSAVILVGQKGVTPALLKELDGALEHHELVKVKLADKDRDSRAASIEQMRESSDAEIVQSIGHVVCLYRRHPREPKFDLPK